MKSYSTLIVIGCLAAAAFAPACTNTANTANRANTTINAPANALPSGNNSSPNAGNAANSAGSANAAAKPFSKTVELHGIKFTVESPNTATGNKVTVTPSGLEATNEAATRDIDGEVYDAEIGDLNVDQSPEVYVYARKSDGDKHASLVAYSANNKKSMSEVSMPAMDPKAKDFAGFNGENEFAVVENSLVQRFPVFDGTGADAKKTGKMRQIQYKLRPGEATWQLYPVKVTEY